MNGRGGRATSLRTGTRGGGGREVSAVQEEKGWGEWRGVGKMRPGSRGSTLISLPLFSAVGGRNSQFPGWLQRDKWNEGSGGKGMGGEGGRFKSRRTTGKQGAKKLEQIPGSPLAL